MIWIRGPWWDGFWIWGCLPIGVVLAILCPGKVGMFVAVVVILDTAHVFSPIILAWRICELRRIVCAEWVKHIVMPTVIMGAAFIVPLSWVSMIYTPWNAYHFGMQNFGVTSLYWRDNRELRKWTCLGVTALGMFVAFPPSVLPQWLWPDPHVSMLCAGIFFFGHWLTDIGLSSRRVRWHWGFIATVLLIAYVWGTLRQGPLSEHVVPQIVAIRLGMGMVHFIYSARIWRFSDPRVRATIGQDLRARSWPMTNKLRVA